MPKNLNGRIEKSEAYMASQAAELIYESSHELLGFMFGDKGAAVSTLERLFKYKKGHFSHSFSFVVIQDDAVAGMILGYDNKQLKQQELIGSLLLVLKSPVRCWWRIITKVGGIVDKYVPEPSDGMYYINNIAVSSDYRGQGIGQLLINHIVSYASENKYKGVELDVTDINQGAIGFYNKLGFREISRTIDMPELSKYELPPLVRMHYIFDEQES